MASILRFAKVFNLWRPRGTNEPFSRIIERHSMASRGLRQYVNHTQCCRSKTSPPTALPTPSSYSLIYVTFATRFACPRFDVCCVKICFSLDVGFSRARSQPKASFPIPGASKIEERKSWIHSFIKGYRTWAPGFCPAARHGHGHGQVLYLDTQTRTQTRIRIRTWTQANPHLAPCVRFVAFWPNTHINAL